MRTCCRSGWCACHQRHSSPRELPTHPAIAASPSAFHLDLLGAESVRKDADGARAVFSEESLQCVCVQALSAVELIPMHHMLPCKKTVRRSQSEDSRCEAAQQCSSRQ